MTITVKELIKVVSGKLTANNLLKIFVFKENYDFQNVVEDVSSVLNREIKEYDIFNKDEFKIMFCNDFDNFYIDRKYPANVRFLTIKI